MPLVTSELVDVILISTSFKSAHTEDYNSNDGSSIFCTSLLNIDRKKTSQASRYYNMTTKQPCKANQRIIAHQFLEITKLVLNYQSPQFLLYLFFSLRRVKDGKWSQNHENAGSQALHGILSPG